MNKFSACTIMFIGLFVNVQAQDADHWLDQYNLTWKTPSRDSYGSMPLGNGDLGANLWMEDNGDLIFYISKTDSWGEDGQLLKVAKVRVSFFPNPMDHETQFKQELNLKNGEVVIGLDGKNPTRLKAWIDANHQIINVASSSKNPLSMTARLEPWRNEPQTVTEFDVSHPYQDSTTLTNLTLSPDTVVSGFKGGIAVYHRNEQSIGPDLSMEFQGLNEFPAYQDPLIHRTFGAVLKLDKLRKQTDAQITSERAREHTLSAHVLTLQPCSGKEWVTAIKDQVAETEKKSYRERYASHVAWWRAFWNRSKIDISTNTAAERDSLVPSNDLPFKVKEDQNGGSRFVGEIARLSLVNKALSQNEISALTKDRDSRPGTVVSDWKTSSEMTIEGWLKPGTLTGSGCRIIDKITAGSSDGLLLDTFPGNSLRLIVGTQVIQAEDVLKADAWTHIAVVIDSRKGSLSLYVGGEKVDEKMTSMEDEGQLVARSYNLQRYIDACGGRGKFPIKFNGSIFTSPHSGNPDYRRWGQGYWWQNTRLPYLSMTMSGDTDLMQPLFKMYGEIFELCEYRTRTYLGIEGAYFPECMYFWGAVFNKSYGWDKPFKDRKDPLQRSPWHKWEWVAGPELVFMMLDYYDYTGDKELLSSRIIPIADAVIRFFDNYYETNDGTLVMHPSMACETWWKCTNPMPETAGLHAITERLLALPDHDLPDSNRKYLMAFKERLPALPLRDTPDGTALAPAEKYEVHNNVENPELYAVFPFRHVAVGREHMDWGKNALKHRWHRGSSGWRQDDLFMAYLGETGQVKQQIVERCRAYDRKQRFPAFWGPNYDWTPDQDHGGVLMKTVQSMLLQADPYSKKLYLLPAWPKDWDASFKLHAPCQTIIEAEYKDGKLIKLDVTPKHREGDIVNCK